MSRGGASIGLATALASACNYGTNMALGRWLGASAFGDAALMVSSLLLLSAVATGIQLSVARTVVVGGGDVAVQRLRRQARRGGLIGGLLLIVTAPLLSGVFHTTSMVPFMLLGASVPVYFALAVRRGLLQAHGAFGRLAATLAVEAVGRAVLTVACLLAGFGAAAAAAGLLGSFVVASAVRVPAVASMSIPRTAGLEAAQASARTAMLLLLGAQVLIANGDLLVVTARLPKEAGVYAAVALIGRIVYVAAWSVVTVVFPKLAEPGAAAQQDALLRRAYVATGVIGGAMTVGAAVGGRALLTALLGADYAAGADLLWPYALATTLFTLANLAAVADVATGSTRAPRLLLLGGVAQTVSLLVLVPRGLSWAVWLQVAAMAGVLISVVGARRREPSPAPSVTRVPGAAALG